jgi:hypothetical protein
VSIEVRLERIYEAAHVQVPAHAQFMSDRGNAIVSASSTIAAEINKTGHRIGSDVAALAEELVFRIGTVVATMNDSAVALDNIADDFAATDAEAAAFFAEHQNWLDQHHYDDAPASSPVPTWPEG